MDRAHIDALKRARKLTAAQHERLRALEDENGVIDPKNASIADVRLWFKHHPRDEQLCGAVATTAEIVAQGTRRDLIFALRKPEVVRCTYLNDRLREWLDVTRERLILEAVVAAWLRLWGLVDFDHLDVEDVRMLSVAEVASDPGVLMLEMLHFKRNYSVHAVSPRAIVDKLALEKDWWAEGSPGRAEAFVRVALEEQLADDEWVHRDELVEWSGVPAADEAIDRLVERESLCLLEACGGVSTPPIYGCSRAVKRLLNKFAEHKAAPWPAYDGADALSCEQRVILDRLAGGERVLLCSAPAGTGKTFTAVCAAEACKGDVVCLAPTWKALSVLRGKVQSPRCSFLTVQSFVCRSLRGEVAPLASLVVVDEASMVSMSQIRHILAGYEHATKTRLLFLGDHAQLPCFGRGFPIRDVAKVLPPVALTKCQRTELEGLCRVAQCVRSGTPVESNDSVVVEACARPMDAIRSLGLFPTQVCMPWEPGYVQFVTPQNNHVKMINEEIHARLLPTATSVGSCRVGDPVRAIANGDSYKNGDEGQLVDVAEPAAGRKRERSPVHGVVQFRGGDRLKVPEAHIVPAYAATVHKVQGSEYENVVLAMFPGTNPKMKSREMAYTSATRARRHLALVGEISGLSLWPSIVRRTVFDYV